jgi:hypothetical protein
LKAQWSSPRGQATSRNRNFALFSYLFDIFSDSVSLKLEAHQFLAQLDRRCHL